MAYVVMAYVIVMVQHTSVMVMAHIGITYIVMAYIVMAERRHVMVMAYIYIRPV